MLRYIVRKYVKISDDIMYISYLNVIDREACIKANLDYIEELNKQNVTENRGKSSIDFESISTAGLILSYSRVYMLNVMIYVICNGGKIYYTDTDSLDDNSLNIPYTSTLKKLFFLRWV